VSKDEAKEYQDALKLYIHSMEYFLTGLKYSKNKNTNEMVRAKVKEFLQRSEAIKVYVAALEAQQLKKQNSKQKVGIRQDSDTEDAKLRHELEATILKTKPTVKLDDVAGLGIAKQALEEAVLFPTKFPQLFTGNRKPWKGILLYGPPGTGKTLLAKAIANSADSTFFSVSASDLVSKYMGESEKSIKQLFNMAKEQKPAIIFIDEIDAIAGTRKEDEHEATKRIKTELLVQMSKIAEESGVLVLGATNRPWDLDPAIRRRFDKRVYIPLPDLKTRLELFNLQLNGEPAQLDKNSVSKFAQKTENYSCADINTLVREALMGPVRDALKSSHWKQVIYNGKPMMAPCDPDEPGAVQTSLLNLQPESVLIPDASLQHFEKALHNIRPSVSQHDLAKFDEYTNMYGEPGVVQVEEPPVAEVEIVQENSSPNVDAPVPAPLVKPNEKGVKKKSPRKKLQPSLVAL